MFSWVLLCESVQSRSSYCKQVFRLYLGITIHLVDYLISLVCSSLTQFKTQAMHIFLLVIDDLAVEVESLQRRIEGQLKLL